MKLRMWIVAALLVSTLSCRARPPLEEVGGAKEAIESARGRGADRYAPESFAAAERAYAALEAELAAQAKRNFLSRSYDQAESLASEARLAGEKAEADAESGRARSKSEAASEVERAADSLLATERYLEKVRKTGTIRSEWPALKAGLGEAESLIEGARGDFGGERYDEAASGARAALERLSKIREAAAKAAARPASAAKPSPAAKPAAKPGPAVSAAPGGTSQGDAETAGGSGKKSKPAKGK